MLAIVLLAVLVVSYIVLRRLRKKNHKPKYIPTSYLKQKWQHWSPGNTYSHMPGMPGREQLHDRLRELSTTDTAYEPTRNATEDTAATTAAAAGVDRNTSIRSVMTLPPYSQAPKESEQVIGREGERAGMDTVVEFPETADEEEVRREEQMGSLYQIRLTRRQEIAERERHRRERREARANHDWDRLEQLRLESRARAEAANLGALADGSTTNLSAAAMLAEHQSRGRERRISSVAYAAVGHVRHDGTRLRAKSNESERGGLLDGAEPMGERQGRGHGRAASGNSSIFSILPPPHTRGRSTSSVLSISSTASDLENGQAVHHTPPSTRDGRTRSSGESNPRGTGTSESSPTAIRFTPEASTGSDDIGDSQIPAPVEGVVSAGTEPPNYDQLEWGEAPAYESPVQDRGQAPIHSLDTQIAARRKPVPASSASGSRGDGTPTRIASMAPKLPRIETLPSISVEGATEPNTPVSPGNRHDQHPPE